MDKDRTPSAGAQVRKLRESLGLTQEEFAEKVGVQRNTVWRWENGRASPMESLPKISRAFDVSIAYILGEGSAGRGADGPEGPTPGGLIFDGELEPSVPPQILLPVIDQEACAGDGFSYDDVESAAIDWIPFPTLGLGGATGPHKPYFVRVNGDSMIGVKINHGSFVAINPNIEVRNGDNVYVKWKGRCSIKGFIQYDDAIELRPANPNYHSTWIKRENWEELEILGKVVRVLNIDLPESVL